MNNTKLLLLTAGTVVLVLITIFAVTSEEANGPQPSNSAAPESLIPGLQENLDSIATIEINMGNPEANITLTQKGDTWHLEQQDGYFVDEKKVNDFLLGFRLFKPLEQKTGNPDRYADIGVQDPDGESDNIGQVILKDSANKELANVILGDQASSIAGQTRRYVRIPTEKNAWLVETNATINNSPTYWMNLQILDIPVADFTSVEINPWSGETLNIDKPTTDSAWALLQLPEGEELTSPRDLENMPRVFQRLNFESVRKASPSASDAFTSATTVLARTFNGLEVSATMKNDPDSTNWWATFAVNYNSEARNSAAAKQTEEETKTLAADLNKKLDGWLYQIPLWKVNNLTKPVDEYIKKPQEETPAPPQGQAPQLQGLPEGFTLTPEMMQQLQGAPNP
ncbi:MAG: DUF4340 domain-containing protein [Sumerlaeia bacterium]